MTKVKCVKSMNCKNVNTEKCKKCKRNRNALVDNYVNRGPSREEIERFFVD